MTDDLIRRLGHRHTKRKTVRTQETATYKLRTEVSGGANPAETLVSDFSPPDL